MVGTRGGPEERQTTANRGTIKRRKVLDLRPADILPTNHPICYCSTRWGSPQNRKYGYSELALYFGENWAPDRDHVHVLRTILELWISK